MTKELISFSIMLIGLRGSRMSKIKIVFLIILIFSIIIHIVHADVVLDKSGLDLEYYQKFQNSNIVINVYNWGEYIADGSDDSLDINRAFTELTDIKVNYTTYDSNDEMYVHLSHVDANYDVVMPSDYMINKLVEAGFLHKLDFSQIPNYKNILEDFLTTDYDPTGEYSLPYAWGMTGIIYNTNFVNEPEDEISWNILFDKKYKGKILMYSNSRYSFAVAAAYLGYSINTTNETELKHIASVLQTQKPLVRAYVADEIYEKMETDKAVVATYYAGDSLNMMSFKPELNFVIPKSGANLFTDTVVIPTTSQYVEAAHMYINFLNEPLVALENIQYIKYSSANKAAIDLLPDDIKNNKIIYPSEDVVENSEVFSPLPNETSKLITTLWSNMVLTENKVSHRFTPVILILTILISMIIIKFPKKKKK